MAIERNALFDILRKRFKALSQDELFSCARNNIKAFVGANFAGIADNCGSDREGSLLEGLAVEQIREVAFEELSFDYNRPFRGVRLIECLWLSKVIFDFFVFDNFEHLLWRFRLFNIWAKILTEREVALKQKSAELTDLISKKIDGTFCERHLDYLLEKVYFHMYYFEYAAAKEILNEATKLAGIEQITLTGALGRRTHHQQKSLPQLLVELKLIIPSEEDGNAILDNSSNKNLPINCKSDDDTLLEEVIFDDKTINEKRRLKLRGRLVACVLATALLERQTNTFCKELGNETTLPFLQEVVRQQCCWSLQTRALIERSLLEMENSRRVERACVQLEKIARSLDLDSSNQGDFSNRFEMLFASSPVPFWTVKKMYAKLLVSLGCVSEALLIFQQLELFEDVARCFILGGQPEKAESLVRTLLERKEDPLYYCLLGDITHNPAYYQKAIQMSGNKLAQAHTSLGQLMLRQKNYVEAFTHLNNSAKILPLQLNVWFNLGFCAMQIKDFRTAVNAFHRCVNIEPEHFEAWNNLAACYIHLGQKHRAQKIFLEALKLNWENSRVWENLILISTDIGDFHQAIIAIQKLLDLDSKREMDELPLELIATEFLNNPDLVPDMKNSLLSIFSRLNSRQSLDPKMLSLYAQIKRSV